MSTWSLAVVASVVVAYALVSRRLERTPVTAGIVFATVYLSLHYVVDIVAGALLAVVMLLAAPALHRLLAGQPARRWLQF